MSDTYEINEHNQVVAYTSGRRCTDTRAWRDATDLEIQQRDELAGLRAEVTILINLVADIRAAVGDPTGTLMQDELVERCHHLVITRDEARRERDEARKIAGDMFVVLDELGCGMEPLPWEGTND